MKTAFPPKVGAACLFAAIVLAPAPAALALTDDMAVSAAAGMQETEQGFPAWDAGEEATAMRGADDLSRFAEDGVPDDGGDDGGSGWEFEAADSSANYPAGTDWNGANGGSGFEAWTSVGDEPGSRTVAADGGFYLQAADPGQSAVVMRRELDTAAGLEEGTLSVKSWGYADEPGDFVGFAIYGSDVEIFRWGLGMEDGEDGEDVIAVFKYSTDGGGTYTVVREGYPASGADFSLTWSSLDGGMSLVWSERTYFPGGHAVTLETAAPVTAIAAVLEEGGLYSADHDGTELVFDNLSVGGNPPSSSVPEPAASALLLSGLAALLLRRRARGRTPPQKR